MRPATALYRWPVRPGRRHAARLPDVGDARLAGRAARRRRRAVLGLARRRPAARARRAIASTRSICRRSATASAAARTRWRTGSSSSKGFEKRLDITRPVIVGHSLGAGVAAAEGLARPRDVAGVVLLDGDALAFGGSRGWLSDLLVYPYYTAAYRLATGSDWVVGSVLRNAWGPHPPPLSARDARRVRAPVPGGRDGRRAEAARRRRHPRPHAAGACAAPRAAGRPLGRGRQRRLARERPRLRRRSPHASRDDPPGRGTSRCSRGRRRWRGGSSRSSGLAWTPREEHRAPDEAGEAEQLEDSAPPGRQLLVEQDEARGDRHRVRRERREPRRRQRATGLECLLEESRPERVDDEERHEGDEPVARRTRRASRGCRPPRTRGRPRDREPARARSAPALPSARGRPRRARRARSPRRTGRACGRPGSCSRARARAGAVRPRLRRPRPAGGAGGDPGGRVR